MKFKRYVIYSMKNSNVEYVLGVKPKNYYFLYFRVKGTNDWMHYPSKKPEPLKCSFLKDEHNKKVSTTQEISKEKLFTEIL